MKPTNLYIISILIITFVFTTETKSQVIIKTKPVIMNNSVGHEALIYPNPVTENRFKVKSEALIATIDVINVIGQSIKHQENYSNENTEIEVQLGDCEKGMYLVKITFRDEKTLIKKLLIK